MRACQPIVDFSDSGGATEQQRLTDIEKFLSDTRVLLMCDTASSARCQPVSDGSQDTRRNSGRERAFEKQQRAHPP